MVKQDGRNENGIVGIVYLSVIEAEDLKRDCGASMPAF